MRDNLKSKVARIRWYVRGLRSIEWGCHLLFWALIVACALVLVERMFALEFDVWPVVITVLGAAIVVGLTVGASRRVTAFDAALLADERMALRERLSSALLLRSAEERMVRALHADAQECARRLQVRETVPFSLPRRARFLPIPAAALLLLGLFFPRLDLLHLRSERSALQAEKNEIERHADRLEEVGRKIVAAQEVRPATEVVKLSQEIKKISEELKKERLDRTQALAKVSSLSDKLEEQRKKLLEKSGLSRRLGAAQDFGQLEDFAKSLGDQEFEKAAAQLRKMASDIKAGNLTEGSKASLAGDLEKVAALLHENPELSRALADMSRGLRAEDMGALNLAFDDALATLADLEDVLEQLAFLDAVLQDVTLNKLALAGQISTCTSCQGCGKCRACGGSRKCPGCGGSGKTGTGDSCGLCGGSGICPFCRGSGRCMGCGGSGFCQNGQGVGGVGLGAGRGLGPRPVDDGVLTSFRDTQIPGRLQPGKILAAIRVKGQQVRGESTVEVVEAFREVRQSAEHALSKESIPIGMKSRVKDYFDAIDPYVSAAVPMEGEAEHHGDDHP